MAASAPESRPAGTILPEARRLGALAWPVILTSLNWTLMHLIDVAVVGRAGVEELAALAASRSVTFVAIVAGLSALTGTLVMAARADGAGDRLATGRCLRTGLLYALVLGALSTLALLFGGEAALRVAGVPAPLVAEGGAVVRAMALAFPAQMILTATGYFLEGISRPRRAMAVNLVMLPANALLAWAWVGGHGGFPAMGAVGAALATATVSSVAALMLLAAAWNLPDAAARDVRAMSAAAWKAAAGDVPALARFGAVPAFAAGLELAGFAWLIVLSTRAGDVTASAFQTMFSLHNLAFAASLGFGSAAGVRVGNAVGAGVPRAALLRTAVACGLAALATGLVGAMFFATRAAIVVPLSPPDGRVVAEAAGLLAILAPFMLFDGVQVVLAYALRSLGDQLAAGVNGIIAFFLVTGGLGWIATVQGYGGAGLALASGAGMLAAALLQAGRFAIVMRRIS